jgi:hypothetical protein
MDSPVVGSIRPRTQRRLRSAGRNSGGDCRGARGETRWGTQTVHTQCRPVSFTNKPSRWIPGMRCRTLL